MALVLVRIFSDIAEAQVAASALRAAGLHPSLPEAEIGSTYWYVQQGLGGLRLCVPEQEAADAAIVLQDARVPDDEDASLSSYDRGGGLRTAGAIGAWAVNPALGWMFTRRRPLSADLWVAFALTCGLMLTGLIVLALLLSALTPAPIAY